MPRQRHKELVAGKHFSWLLGQRKGIWTADGRTNPQNAGRHSLGTQDRTEALKRLHELDAVVAADLGLASKPKAAAVEAAALPLEEGRRLYDSHIRRPRVAGGVRASTQKRYRAVFDKFLDFTTSKGIASWNEVTHTILLDYASHLEVKDYAGKTLKNELATLVQCFNWLVRKNISWASNRCISSLGTSRVSERIAIPRSRSKPWLPTAGASLALLGSPM